MSCTRPTLTFLAALLSGTSAFAQAQEQVVLSSTDGVMSISGTLLGFDDEFYTLESTLGTIQVPIALSTCTGQACPEIHPLDQEIRAVGPAFLMDPLLPAAISEYAREIEASLQTVGSAASDKSLALTNGEFETLARFDLKDAGPAAALQSLLNNEAELAFLSRRVSAQEAQAFEAAGLGDLRSFERERIIAQDGLVVLVSADAGVSALTLADISGIYSGQFRNWADFGGADVPIRVIAPERNSGAAEYFFERVLDPEFGVFADDVEYVGDFEAIAKEVGQGSGVIGLTSSTATSYSNAVGIASSCGIVVPVNDFTIKSEDYPLARRMYLYSTSAELPSRTEKIVAVLEHEKAEAFVAAGGFTTFATRETTLAQEGNRLAHALANPDQARELPNLVEFAGETIDAKRLSFTFRFAFGSSRLDNKALADIERLIAALEASDLAEMDVLVVGFTDSTGDSKINTQLSQQRAEQVLQDVVSAAAGRLDPDRFRALGYGAAAPVACNGTEAERQLNRRVEIWVR